MLSTDLQIAFFVVTFTISYWIWIRPILKTRPCLADFYTWEGGLFAGIAGKFRGIKQKAVGTLLMVISGIVSFHDVVMPYVAQVDWTPLTSRVPEWAWPMIMLSVIFMLDRFRKWSDDRKVAPDA